MQQKMKFKIKILLYIYNIFIRVALLRLQRRKML